MKKIWIVSLTVLAAQSAYALPGPSTLGQTCAKIGDLASYVRDACLAANDATAYFDQYALGACARLQDNVSNQVVYPCVMTVKNKTYTPDEVTNCDNMADEAATLSCFRSAGKPHMTGSPRVSVSVQELENMLDFTTGAINDYQTQTALNALAMMKAKLQAAGALSCK